MRDLATVAERAVGESEKWVAGQQNGAIDPAIVRPSTRRISPTSRVPESHRALAHRAAVLVALRQGWRCRYCGIPFDPMGKDITTDHGVPICRGGDRGPENVVAACRACNVRKAAQTAREFATDACAHSFDDLAAARGRPYTTAEWAYLTRFLTAREAVILTLAAGYGLTFAELSGVTLDGIEHRSDGQAWLRVRDRRHLLDAETTALLDTYVAAHRPKAARHLVLTLRARGGGYHPIPLGEYRNTSHRIEERLYAAGEDHPFAWLALTEDSLLRTYRAGGIPARPTDMAVLGTIGRPVGVAA